MKIDGIDVNPRLRKMFDCTPNEDRSQAEIERWWGVPFVSSCSWDDMKPDASYDDFISRMAAYGGIRDYTPPTREQWEHDIEQRRLNWFESWPSGVRYDVRCLDGGAWDRSTWWGSFATLDEAIACAKGSR